MNPSLFVKTYTNQCGFNIDYMSQVPITILRFVMSVCLMIDLFAFQKNLHIFFAAD